MPKLVTASEASDARRVAIARARKGKGGTFEYMRESFDALEVGGMLVLDEDDLITYKDEAPYIISTMEDGTTFTKAQADILRGLHAALQRQLRKSHGDDAACTSEYLIVDDAPAYGVTRTK